MVREVTRTAMTTNRQCIMW